MDKLSIVLGIIFITAGIFSSNFYIAIVLIVLGSFLSVTYFRGKTSFKFTKMMHKYPNEAYDWFIANSHCWKVFEGTLPADYINEIPSKKMRPQRLIVPKLGNQMIYVYGKFPECRESEKKFLQSLQSNE